MWPYPLAMTNDIHKYVFLPLIYERHRTNLNCIREKLFIRNLLNLKCLKFELNLWFRQSDFILFFDLLLQFQWFFLCFKKQLKIWTPSISFWGFVYLMMNGLKIILDLMKTETFFWHNFETFPNRFLFTFKTEFIFDQIYFGRSFVFLTFQMTDDEIFLRNLKRYHVWTRVRKKTSWRTER